MNIAVKVIRLYYPRVFFTFLKSSRGVGVEILREIIFCNCEKSPMTKKIKTVIKTIIIVNYFRLQYFISINKNK
jgi:hypothetical protein